MKEFDDEVPLVNEIDLSSGPGERAPIAGSCLLVEVPPIARLAVTCADLRRLSSDHSGATDAPPTARSVWTSQSAEEHLGLRKQFR